MSQRESIIAAAEKYLFHGLVEHDGRKVPLAENVTHRDLHPADEVNDRRIQA